MTLWAEGAVQESGLNGLFVTAAAYECRLYGLSDQFRYPAADRQLLVAFRRFLAVNRQVSQ